MKRIRKYRKNRFSKKSKLPSLTIPDQSLSISEILQRHTRGQSYPEYSIAYDSEIPEDYPDISKLDAIEKLELQKEHQEHTENLAQQNINNSKERKKRSQKREVDLQVKAVLAETVKETTKKQTPSEASA